MPRRPPIDPDGLLPRQVARELSAQRSVRDDQQHERFLDAVRTRGSRSTDWETLDWCLMPNHYHLLIQLTEGGLSEGMRELNGGFSRWMQRVYGTNAAPAISSGTAFVARELADEGAPARRLLGTST